jgi:hypothetical protein
MKKAKKTNNIYKTQNTTQKTKDRATRVLFEILNELKMIDEIILFL